MSDIPARFPVSINGRSYQLVVGPDYQRGSPTSQRASMDTSPRAAGGSIATGIALRRSQQDWSGGAGQKYFDEETDRSTSNSTRFWRSVGIDPWTRRELHALPACTSYTLGGAAPPRPTMVALPDVGTAGTIYLSSGTTAPGIRRLVLSATPSTAPTVASVTGVSTCNMLATDGAAVYAATDTGVFSVSGTAATVLASVSTNAHNFVAVCNGRLIAAKTSGELYEYSATGTTVTTFAGAPASTVWRAATGAPKAVLVTGSVGHTSTIYRCTFDESTGSMNAALTPATDFPGGETIYALRWHMGWLLIGTSRGWRVGTVDESGNVTYGPVIDTTGPVYDFAGEDRFVWFTWQGDNTMFGGSTLATAADTPAGTGRMDLGYFPLPLQPAYATDLMDIDSAAVGEITSVVRVNGGTWFAVDAVDSVFTEAGTNLATSGWIESSLIEFGFEGEKIATDVEIRHSADAGTMTVTLETEDSVSTRLGTLGTGGSYRSDQPIPAQNITSEAHRIRLDFLADYEAAVLADLPLSYWPMQETSGSTAVDALGLHDGVLTGITVNQPGPNSPLPKAFELTGGGGGPRIDFGSDDYSFTGDFSVEGWFYVNDEPTPFFVRKADGDAVPTEYQLVVRAGSTSVAILQEGLLSYYLYAGLVGVDVGWRHIVGVLTGTTLTLYVDGVAVASSSPPVGIRQSPSAYALHMGGLTAVGNRVAGLAVYDHALPPESVTAHYRAMSPLAFGATIRRLALRAVPVARTYEVIQIPLMLSETVLAGPDYGEDYSFDTFAEYAALLALKQSREVVVYNELGREVSGVVDEITLGAITRINEKDGQRYHFDGTLLIKFWTV